MNILYTLNTTVYKTVYTLRKTQYRQYTQKCIPAVTVKLEQETSGKLQDASIYIYIYIGSYMQL